VDADARMCEMKDKRTHLAHKAEHAVDLIPAPVLAVTLQGARQRRHDGRWMRRCARLDWPVAELVGRRGRVTAP